MSAKPFAPDWSLAEARKESLREHMSIATELARENERLRLSLSQVCRLMRRYSADQVVRDALRDIQVVLASSGRN